MTLNMAVAMYKYELLNNMWAWRKYNVHSLEKLTESHSLLSLLKAACVPIDKSFSLQPQFAIRGINRTTSILRPHLSLLFYELIY